MPEISMLSFSGELRLTGVELRDLAKVIAEAMYPTAWPPSAVAQFVAAAYFSPGARKDFVCLCHGSRPLGLVVTESMASFSVLHLVATHRCCWGKNVTAAALDLALSRLSAGIPILTKLANARSLTLLRRREFCIFDQPKLLIWQSEVKAFVAAQGAVQSGARLRLASLPSSPWVPRNQVGHPDDERTLSNWQERPGDRILLLRPPRLAAFSTIRRT